MAEPVPISWRELFRTGDPTDASLRLREIKRSGHTFLLLPDSPLLAARALQLYPAQTPLARFAKAVLHAYLGAGLPPPLPLAAVSFALSDPFPQFLTRCAGTERFPRIALFCGNPRAAGRRFILLLFDKSGQPAGVVKAGSRAAANRLIRSEIDFLQSIPAGISGLPKFGAAFESESVTAFAMDYIVGSSPLREDRAAIALLFTGWLDPHREIRAEDIPAWRTFAQTYSEDSRFQALAKQLAGHVFHPTLYHGDFAPWNIRVASDGVWRVIDWERGGQIGFPGWDWFHYVAQSSILVAGNSAETVAEKLAKLIDCPQFRQYAQTAGILRIARPLAAAYLLHFVETVAPGEGLETNRQLASILGGKWSDSPRK